MLLIDDLLLGGLRFVLDKLATVVDQELNDESRLHQTLMEAQMRFEIGEIDAEEFADVERMVIDRLREIRAEREAGAPALTDEGVRISGVEISGPDDDVDVDVDMRGIDMREADVRGDEFGGPAAPVSAAPVNAAPVNAAPVSAAPVSAVPVSAVPVSAAPKAPKAVRARKMRPAAKPRTSARRRETRR